MRIITGFHAIEETLRSHIDAPARIVYNKPGPRVKKILAEAQVQGIPCAEESPEALDQLVLGLGNVERDHRGLVLVIEKDAEEDGHIVNFDSFVASARLKSAGEKSVVLILDSITDPHNVGAIIRSCDQFGVDLVVLPERRSAKDSGVILRSSAGAAAWVSVAVVPNLVRAAGLLKDAGYWVYGAEGKGEPLSSMNVPDRLVLVMGSEGTGIGRLLRETCDGFVSIETRGRLDSLNVSVAAGILLYTVCNRGGIPAV